MKRIVTIAFAAVLVTLVLGCSTILNKEGIQSQIAFETGDYPNGELLVSPEFLDKVLRKPGLVIIDARKSGYDVGHIPGALSMDWRDYTDSSSNLKSIDELEQQLGQAGLSRTATIVIYDDAQHSQGAAERIFWMLEYLGCEDVHVLNGGWEQWKASRGMVEAAPNKPDAATFKASVKDNLLAATDQIAQNLDNTKVALIDARTDEEFNGWTLHNESRGGHIPKAVQIPYEWFYNTDGTLMDNQGLKTLFEQRGVTNDKEVIVYSTAGSRSSLTYFALRLLGYPKVSNYDGSIYAWSADPSLKMEKLAHYEKFVSAAWVKDLIEGKQPPTYKGGDYLILEARYVQSTTTGATADPSTIGYIPGAVSIHPCYLEHENNTAKYYPVYSEPSDGNLLAPDRLRKALGNLGITKDTTVIVYGSGVIIPMTSARVAWALMYSGVKDVRILNGGYPAWLSLNGPTSPAPATPTAVDFGGTVPAHPEFLAKMDYVQKVVSGAKTDSIMVDVRKKEENIGQENPYPFFTAVGKIPGAAWMGNWTELVDMNDSTFRSYTEVRSIWENLGITPDKEPIYYCGTGWRSSIGFFTAAAMGFEKLRNYDGSFYEWSWHPENATKDKK